MKARLRSSPEHPRTRMSCWTTQVPYTQRMYLSPDRKVVDVRTSGMNPRYEGPFKVLSRTPKNTYVLLDNTGALHPKNVPLSKLKLISVPEIFLEDVEHYEVERVLKHKGPTNDRTYWVKWKGYPDSENTWVPAADFDAPLIIQQYWSALKAQTKGKRPRPL